MLNDIGSCGAEPGSWANGWDKAIYTAFDEINEIPAADVRPERHGKWKINRDGYYPYCSKCKEEPESGVMSDFCPHCGAKMDGKDGDQTPDKETPWSKRAPFDPKSITCGRCDHDISDEDYKYCPYCGQKLDWSCLLDSETSFEMDGKKYNVYFDED